MSASLSWVLNTGLVLAAVATWALLWRFARGAGWRATMTPLASIIGSGFLVVAPLLGATVGTLAVVAMAGIVALAFAVGGALRYNIAQVEELVEAEHPAAGLPRRLMWLGRAAKLVLAGAYVVAVTFYLELLGAFALRAVGLEDAGYQKALASVLVVCIGGFGSWRGLTLLERMETRAVETKLGVIAGLLIGLVVYDGGRALSGSWSLPQRMPRWDLNRVRQLLGAFLVVQGFETSRYLGAEYPGELRIATMRRAQLISGAIYVGFVGLVTLLLGRFHRVSETGIIDISRQVASSLPYLLVLGAITSQFSAAVADTIASGGLVEEVSLGRVHRRLAYLGVVALALSLIWTANIFAVIAYASRAFAAYYALQAAMAALHAWSGSRRALSAWFGLLALLMTLTALFGIPADAHS